jgi:hypothetical protein
MPKPGSPAWHRRKEMLLAAERSQPLGWYYISFSDGHFLGACIVRAQGPTTALARSHALGINPGGQALMARVPDHVELPSGVTDRLLSREDLDSKLGGSTRIT